MLRVKSKPKIVHSETGTYRNTLHNGIQKSIIYLYRIVVLLTIETSHNDWFLKMFKFLTLKFNTETLIFI